MISIENAQKIAELSNRLYERGTMIAVAHDGQYVELSPGEMPKFTESELGLWVRGPATAVRITEEIQISEEVARDEEEAYTGILGEVA